MGIEEQITVGKERLKRSTLPAHPLPTQHPDVLRHLGPAYRFRYKDDAIVPFCLAGKAMDLDHQLHVLSDRVTTVAADIQNGLAAEEAKCSRNDGQTIGFAPREARHQKSAQIFDRLKECKAISGQADTYHLSVVDDTAIGHTNGTTHCHRAYRIFNKGAYCPQERIGFKQRICIY